MELNGITESDEINVNLCIAFSKILWGEPFFVCWGVRHWHQVQRHHAEFARPSVRMLYAFSEASLLAAGHLIVQLYVHRTQMPPQVPDGWLGHLGSLDY